MDNLSSAAHFVVGVDGSAPSIKALEFARDLAEKQGAQLRAVTAWGLPATEHRLSSTWSPHDEAAEILTQATRTVFGDHLPGWYEQIVKEGAPTRVLVDESSNADLVIVGTRGRGGFTGLLLGSVSRQCSEHAHCPVVIVR